MQVLCKLIPHNVWTNLEEKCEHKWVCPCQSQSSYFYSIGHCKQKKFNYELFMRIINWSTSVILAHKWNTEIFTPSTVKCFRLPNVYFINWRCNTTNSKGCKFKIISTSFSLINKLLYVECKKKSEILFSLFIIYKIFL